MPDPKRSEIRTLSLILGVFLGLGVLFWGVSEFLSGVPKGIGGGAAPIGTGGGGGGGEGVEYPSGEDDGESEGESEEESESESEGEGEEEEEIEDATAEEASDRQSPAEPYADAEDLSEAERMFREGLVYAGESGKHLFLRFSAPWNPGSWQLTEFLERQMIAELLDQHFTLTEIDLETVEGAKSLYKELTDGGGALPWIALFDPDGNLVSTSQQPDGNLEFPPTAPESRDRFLALFEKTGVFSAEELGTLGSELDEHTRINLR